MEPSVRVAVPEDLPPWLELAAEVGDLFGADMANDPGFRGTIERNIGRGSAFCAEMEDVFAGGMLFRNGTINWLAVRRRDRRRGVGRALVSFALGSGADSVRVTTFAADHPHPEARAARELYLAMGFVPSDEKPEFVPDGTSRDEFVWSR
jgi:ribosomal protein S18 acetylase RimI-like enzyme